MRTVYEHIDAQSRRLGAHPFFTELRPQPDLRRALAFAPILAPWVMGFQDVIRVNATLARDPSIKHKLQRHVVEDQGHELWFLEDLRLLFGSGMCDVAWLFGNETAVTREATLAIAAEVFHMRDDRLRLAFVEALEAGARTFIERVNRHVRESGDAGQLKYFGGAHEQAEAKHETLDDGAEQRSHALDLPDGVRSDALAMVDRIFAEFSRIAEAARPRPSSAG